MAAPRHGNGSSSGSEGAHREARIIQASFATDAAASEPKAASSALARQPSPPTVPFGGARRAQRSPASAQEAPAWFRAQHTAAVQRAVAAPLPSTIRREGAAQPAGGRATLLPPDFLSDTASDPGQPLPPAVRRQMESALKADLSDVRIHVSPKPTAIGALAFTAGSQMYFAPGQFQPQTPQGVLLLKRQLEYVIQQRTGQVRNPFGTGVAMIAGSAQTPIAERNIHTERPLQVHAIQRMNKGEKGVKAMVEGYKRVFEADGNYHAEQVAVSFAVNNKGLSDFVINQNAWPCTAKCHPWLTVMSKKHNLKITINIEQDYGLYSLDHEKPKDSTGTIVYDKGEVTYS